jgi:hypothetical protein
VIGYLRWFPHYSRVEASKSILVGGGLIARKKLTKFRSEGPTQRTVGCHFCIARHPNGVPKRSEGV